MKSAVQTIHYISAATTLSATMLAVVVHTASKTHLALVDISTPDPDDPAYQRAAEAILTGFQVLPPVL